MQINIKRLEKFLVSLTTFLCYLITLKNAQNYGLGDTERWIIDLLRNDPHKTQTELRTKSAYKGREINERQMNDIITKLFDNHLIDSDIGKKRGARYFSLI